MSDFVLVGARSGLEMAESIAAALGTGVLKSRVQPFADGEMEVALQGSVSGKRVAVVQTFAAPVHDSIMELLMLVDAVRRGGAEHITAVVPYLGYSRQDREVRPGVAVSAEVVARMMESSGVDRMVTVDVHSARVSGNYGIPFENVSAMTVLAQRAARALQGERICVVSPDAGGMGRAEHFAKILAQMGAEVGVAMVEKERSGPNVVSSARLVGLVEGCHCVLVDDMIDTAGTLCAAAAVLRDGGAGAVSASAVHGLFNGPAVERLLGQGFAHLWVTDTLPLREEVGNLSTLETVSVAGILAKEVMSG